MQFRCSAVSSGQVVCFVIHGLLRCSCTRTSASLDQTITRTNAYMYTVACARVALRWTSAHACSPMQANGFVSCVRCDTSRISLTVILLSASLLLEPSIWSFRSYCFWSTEPSLIAPDVIRTTLLNSSAVTDMHSNMEFYGPSVL